MSKDRFKEKALDDFFKSDNPEKIMFPTQKTKTNKKIIKLRRSDG